MRLDAYHLPTPSGAAFCTVCLPQLPAAPKFAVLALLPFAEENNKCRRMVMLQARQLAERGGVTVLLDPSGTGDSLSEFREATWEIWLDEARMALEHVRARYSNEAWIWGIRTGALLAMQTEDRLGHKPSGVLLWQPVLSGKSYLSQFFRLSVASRMLSASGPAGAADASPRQRLAAGAHVEVGGYEIGPSLALPMEECALEGFRPSVGVVWLECSPAGEMSTGSTRLVSKWRDEGVRVVTGSVTGPSFWASQEIETSDVLVQATTKLLADAISGHADR